MKQYAILSEYIYIRIIDVPISKEDDLSFLCKVTVIDHWLLCDDIVRIFDGLHSLIRKLLFSQSNNVRIATLYTKLTKCLSLQVVKVTTMPHIIQCIPVFLPHEEFQVR